MSTQVAILMGSKSDWPVMQECAKILAEFGVEHNVKVASAHRTPGDVTTFIKDSESNGAKVFIAAAGGAAHLPGVVAAFTQKPVIGVPMKGWALDGLDSLLSIVQMPAGIPVATTAIGKAGAKNSALLAIQMLAISDESLSSKLAEYREIMAEQVRASNDEIK